MGPAFSINENLNRFKRYLKVLVIYGTNIHKGQTIVH